MLRHGQVICQVQPARTYIATLSHGQIGCQTQPPRLHLWSAMVRSTKPGHNNYAAMLSQGQLRYQIQPARACSVTVSHGQIGCQIQPARTCVNMVSHEQISCQLQQARFYNGPLQPATTSQVGAPRSAPENCKSMTQEYKYDENYTCYKTLDYNYTTVQSQVCSQDKQNQPRLARSAQSLPGPATFLPFAIAISKYSQKMQQN